MKLTEQLKEEGMRVSVDEWTTGKLELRSEVEEFAQKMEAQLRRNDHKGGWLAISLHRLCGRMFEEWLELRDELNKPQMDSRRVQEEAADVANFAMMVSSSINNRWTKMGVEV